VVLDGRADGAQDPADLRAQEDQGDDRHDRDEGEDQRVLRETLAFLVIPVKEIDDCGKELHLGGHLLSFSDPLPPRSGSPFPGEESSANVDGSHSWCQPTQQYWVGGNACEPVRPANTWSRRACYRRCRLNGGTDRAEDAAHLGAQEDQGDDCNDRDQCKDERVLSKPLAPGIANRCQKPMNECHFRRPFPPADARVPMARVGAEI